MQWIERAAVEAAVLAHRLAAEGFRSVALSFTDDAYGRTAGAVFANVWAGLLGNSVTETLLMPAGRSDYSAQIATLASAGGDCVVVLGELGAGAQQSFLSGLTDSGGFDTLAVTSPWYDASFGPSVALGLDLRGISIVADAARLLDASTGTAILTTTTVAALVGGRLQIGQGVAPDFMQGTSGPDVLFGRAGQDSLQGGDWQDHLEGGADRDMLFGGSGNDRLYGGSGNDVLAGGLGRDTLQGDGGRDMLTGGTGADQFVFGNGGGADVLKDFNRGSGDRLLLDDALWGGGLTRGEVVQTFASVTAQGVVLDFGDGDRVTLLGISSLDGLAASLVIF